MQLGQFRFKGSFLFVSDTQRMAFCHPLRTADRNYISLRTGSRSFWLGHFYKSARLFLILDFGRKFWIQRARGKVRIMEVRRAINEVCRRISAEPVESSTAKQNKKILKSAYERFWREKFSTKVADSASPRICGRRVNSFLQFLHFIRQRIINLEEDTG